MTEEEGRAALVVEGRTWLGTPYHHGAAVRGSGVDCARVLAEAYFGSGIVERFDILPYRHDWHLHRNEERYLEIVERYLRRADDTEDPYEQRPGFVGLPGDILVWRVGRTFSHGALITEWPYILHAYFPSRMVEEVDIRGTPMAERPMRVYSYWGNGA